MKFRIYSDSWAWSWWDNNILCSQSIENFDNYKGALSLVKIILEAFGHEVLIKGKPGRGVHKVTEMLITDIKNYSVNKTNNEKEIWLFLISSPLRDVIRRRLFNYPTLEFSSIDNFFTSHNSILTAHLQCVSDCMNAHFKNNNICIIPMGGQIQLPIDCFDAVKNCHPAMKFGCEWVLAFLEDYKNLRDLDTGHIFQGLIKNKAEQYFTDENKLWQEKWSVNNDAGELRQLQAMRVFLQDSHLVAECFDHELQKNGKLVSSKSQLELIEFLADVHEAGWNILRPVNFKVLYPDKGHLGWNGHVLFADWILLTAERMGFIKN